MTKTVVQRKKTEVRQVEPKRPSPFRLKVEERSKASQNEERDPALKVGTYVTLEDVLNHVGYHSRTRRVRETRLSPKVASVIVGLIGGQDLTRDAEVQRLVDVSDAGLDKADAIQARMRAKAVELVMNGTSWLTATELFDELPKKPSNAHTVLARWLDQGRIFAMEKSGVRIYPRYAFDAMVEPVPLLKEVLKVLAGRSPFQIASWFESPSNYLDGKRPREVLETNGLAVVTAAQRLVEGAVHG
ncbi:hypothetical protein [Pelomonas cellulosilytica]|uniref:Antitoxin Xre/MbcA/ParS-like toxin-binding domain-containing protein n=1 Tax=Pelomonas cellulosilytica TaxID=2906762 RepID=A0ABS8Y686_9BURK|nr:hypothetical protein [Pelomonas sp. P8]MCE4558180.1 hypothetical protein [Pelomonas sp. P8]